MTFTTVRLTRETWKTIQAEREPNETIDETIKRLIEDRYKFRKMIRAEGGSALA